MLNPCLLGCHNSTLTVRSLVEVGELLAHQLVRPSFLFADSQVYQSKYYETHSLVAVLRDN